MIVWAYKSFSSTALGQALDKGVRITTIAIESMSEKMVNLDPKSDKFEILAALRKEQENTRAELYHQMDPKNYKS